jgi:ABC-type glycerol-3-phosphate transport system substrate-binding protein
MTKKINMSRRDFLKLAGTSAVAMTAAGIIQACATATEEPEEAPTEAPTEAAEKVTLTLAIQAFAHDAMLPILDEWQEMTGHTVNLESGPTTGQEMMTKYAPAFQSGTSPVDVLSLDDVSGPAFARADWLDPLDEVIPQETWDDFPESFLPPPDEDPFHSYEGKRYRVPHEFAVGYFWYRKDWFEADGIEVPTTWDEFVEVGKHYTSGDVWGVTEGMKKPALTFVYIAHLAAAADGDVFAFDEGTAEALQFNYDMIHTHGIMSENVLTQDYTQQNDLYMKDRAAMMRQWPYYWGVSRDNTEWYEEGKAEIALHPAGPAGSKTWWGGWGFSLPKFLEHTAEAEDLIAWVANNKNAPILAEGQSWFVMPRYSILDAMEGGLVPFMQLYAEENALVPRPYHPKQADAEVIVDDVSQLYLTNQLSLNEALEEGKKLMEALG